MEKELIKNRILKATLLFIVFFIGVYAALYGQDVSKEKQFEKSLKAHHKKVLKQSLAYDDVDNAIKALQNIIAIEGEHSAYKDSLSVLYYKSGQYTSSYLLSKELIVKHPRDPNQLEIQTLSLQKLGDYHKAIPVCEQLLSVTNMRYHAYQLAYLQFLMKRYTESKDNLAYALILEENKEKMLPFASIKEKEKLQNIPLDAAIYYLQGLVFYAQNNIEKAKIHFKKALKIIPDFEHAKHSLESLTQLINSKQ